MLARGLGGTRDFPNLGDTRDFSRCEPRLRFVPVCLPGNRLVCTKPSEIGRSPSASCGEVAVTCQYVNGTAYHHTWNHGSKQPRMGAHTPLIVWLRNGDVTIESINRGKIFYFFKRLLTVRKVQILKVISVHVKQRDYTNYPFASYTHVRNVHVLSPSLSHPPGIHSLSRSLMVGRHPHSPHPSPLVPTH